jgi:hypothetical protein
MALSSVSVVVSSLLLNLYTPPGAPAWHQNVIRRVNLALKSRRLMRFNRVRVCADVWPNCHVSQTTYRALQMADEGKELNSSIQVVVGAQR